MQCDATEQIKQIRPECPIPNGFPQIFPGCCDNSQIERPGFARAVRPALSSFYEAQKRGLLLQRKRAHIVEQNRPSMRSLEMADNALWRVMLGRRFLHRHAAKHLRVKIFLGKGGAAYLHERLGLSMA